MRIAVVEDNASVAAAVVAALSTCGHEADWLSRGADVLERHAAFDAILLDLGLPDRDGLEVLSDIRAVSTVPVVVLTARGDENSVVQGLRGGADDYIVKPVRLRELVARIDAVVRRTRLAPAVEDVIVVGALEFDPRARQVTVGGDSVELTKKEFGILSVLVRQADTAVSRQSIIEEVWGGNYVVVTRALDVHIAGLRTKIGPDPRIETIRGFGYRLVAA
ncbi:response regulator transcription factor [Rhodococcoides corynebacterioides]|uniref:response regulator transcription factor n=1 Tax=Rhodococcoides corynebacterioides TaxID=53972 RepID=UPI001C9AC3B5|nr:response regulator transcription factor [Rhodococcus corynebacterioides]MBY6350947.1 response regulator transcription factor [Rhodococcus corynebacterioides]